MKSKLFSAICIVALVFAASLTATAQNGINPEPLSVKPNIAKVTIPSARPEGSPEIVSAMHDSGAVAAQDFSNHPHITRRTPVVVFPAFHFTKLEVKVQNQSVAP